MVRAILSNKEAWVKAMSLDEFTGLDPAGYKGEHNSIGGNGATDQLRHSQCGPLKVSTLPRPSCQAIVRPASTP